MEKMLLNRTTLNQLIARLVKMRDDYNAGDLPVVVETGVGYRSYRCAWVEEDDEIFIDGYIQNDVSRMLAIRFNHKEI